MSEEIASADNLLREQLHQAYKLIGRLDYFLETFSSQPAAAQKKLAAQLRREIAAQAGLAPPKPAKRPIAKKPAVKKPPARPRRKRA
jgi:hypothetical protein